MNNFFKIYINELTKVLKKKSTKVFLILLLLTLLVCVGFTYLTKLSNEKIGEISNTYSLTYAKQRFESLDENSGTYNEEYVSALLCNKIRFGIPHIYCVLIVFIFICPANVIAIVIFSTFNIFYFNLTVFALITYY